MWKSDEGKTVSYWQATADNLRNETLHEASETDVCIIGGGISGLTTAYLLTKAGKKVIVVDDGAIGGGETSRTTAHLANALDDRIYRVAEWHGDEHAQAGGRKSRRGYRVRLKKSVAEENIDCDFLRVDGFLIEAEDGGEDDLQKEFDEAHRLGFSDD